MSKLLENTFCMIKIELAFEVALMCERLDVNGWEVIDADRESPAMDVIALPRKKGAIMENDGPNIQLIHNEHDGRKIDNISDTQLMDSIKSADGVIIITDYSTYEYAAIIAAATFIFDSFKTLCAFSSKDTSKIVRLNSEVKLRLKNSNPRINSFISIY